MIKNHISIILCALSLLFSCTDREILLKLEEVESYVNEEPERALDELVRIDRSRLRGRKILAQFSLLHAMALDKSYVDTSDVNVVMPAVEYYDAHGPAAKAMKSWFYLGREQENGGEYQDAVISYTRAKEFARKTDDLHFRALIASGMADLFRKTYNDEERIANSIEAYNLYKQAGDTLDCWICIGELATAYANARQWEKADSLFQKFYSYGVIDTLQMSIILLAHAESMMLRPDKSPEKSLELVEAAIENYGAELSEYYAGMYAYASELFGDEEFSDHILERFDGLEIALWKYYVYRDRKLYYRSLQELEKGCHYQDSIIIETLHQSISRAQRDYFEAKSELLAEDRLRQRTNMAIVILVLLLIIVSSSFIAFLSIRKYRNTKERMAGIRVKAERQKCEFERYVDLSNREISKKEKVISELKYMFVEKYKSQFDMLNELCVKYWMSERGKDRDKIYDEVKKIVLSIYEGSGINSDFENRINRGLDDVMKKLRSDFPDYTETDFRFLSYVIAGFEAKTISNIMNISCSNVYTKKSRMKDKILSSGSENVELYRMCLN